MHKKEQVMISLSQQEQIVELEKENIALQQRIIELEAQLQENKQKLDAAEAAQNEQRKLFALLEELPAYIYLLSSDYSIHFVNRYFREHFGVPENAPCYQIIAGREEPCEFCPVFDVFENPKVPRVWEKQAINGKIYQVHAYPYTDTDGTNLVLELGIDISQRKKAEEALRLTHADLEKRVKERTNELYQTNQALEQEITERQRIEEELHKSQALLQSIVDSIPAAIYVRDTQGKFMLVNGYQSQLFQMEREHIIGKTESDIFESEEAVSWRITDEQVLTTGKAVEFDQAFIHDDGLHSYLTIKFLIYDEKFDICAIGGISTDITGRKRVEEALRQSEERYRAIVENQTEHIARFRPDGTFTFANEAYCLYLGKKFSELNRRNIVAFVPSEDRKQIRLHFSSFSRKKAFATREHRIMTASGEIRWQQSTDHAIFDATGRLIEFLSVGRDITELRNLQQALNDCEEHRRHLMATHEQHDR